MGHGKKSEICAALCGLVKDGKISAIDVVKFESTNYLSKETIRLLEPSLLGNVRFKPMEVSVTMRPSGVRGVPNKQQVIGVLGELVSDGKLQQLDVELFRDTGVLHQHTEDCIREFFPDWLPYKEPVSEAKPKLEVIQRPDAPWKF